MCDAANGAAYRVGPDTFSELGADVVSAHAKQLNALGQEVSTADPAGVLDYDAYLGVLQGIGYTGPLILHGLPEAAVAESIRYLNDIL